MPDDRSGRDDDLAADQRLDLLDRAGRALPGRPFVTSTPPAASERGDTVRIQGMPSSSASVNFTPGDSSRSS